MPTLSFQVRGMRSRQCVRTVSRRVSDVVGVLTVEVNLGAGTLRIFGTPDAAAVLAAITSAGYEASAVPSQRSDARRSHRRAASTP